MSAGSKHNQVITGAEDKLARLRLHRELEWLRTVGDVYGRARHNRRKKKVMLARRARLVERSEKLRQVGR